MRVLAVHPGANFSVSDVHNGWVEALRELNVTVADFNLDRRLDLYSQACLPGADGEYYQALTAEQAIELAINGLYSALWRFLPDVLLVTSGFFLDAQALGMVRSRGVRVVLVHTESPYEDDRQLQRCAAADINLINDPTHLDAFRQVCPATWYVPHAYRPKVHYPQPPDPDCASDFCFVGTGYESRIQFLEAVDFAGLAVSLAGNWASLSDDSPLRHYLRHGADECCDNTDTARLYASTRASANLYRREANHADLSAGWAMTPREVELAAMGVFFLRQQRPEGDEVLPMLPTFADPADFTDQLSWWLDHDDARHDAARLARDAITDRTFTAHARQLLRLLGA